MSTLVSHMQRWTRHECVWGLRLARALLVPGMISIMASCSPPLGNETVEADFLRLYPGRAVVSMNPGDGNDEFVDYYIMAKLARADEEEYVLHYRYTKERGWWVYGHARMADVRR